MHIVEAVEKVWDTCAFGTFKREKLLKTMSRLPVATSERGPTLAWQVAF